VTTYKVVHFVPELKGGMFSAEGPPISKQIEQIVNRYAAEGWEFVSYQTAHYFVRPGCFAGLFGQREQIHYYDILVLAKYDAA